ncbi:cellulose biosynthesis protein BcsE [Enterobacterales bacterium CwR94]|nr:cellulose biosynthesis protein BcsE [Enterobacterales bacterium CwR94]
MTLSLTLGLDNVRDELMQMTSPGCYWITTHRQEDARKVARQCIAAQRQLVLISSVDSPQTLLAPHLKTGPEKIPMFSFPGHPRALADFTQDLTRVLSPKPRMLLFYTAVEQWEKLPSRALINWLTHVNKWLAAQQSTLLIITAGSGINNLRNHLQTFYRHLEGLSHLEWQQDSFNYRINWWMNVHGMFADRELRLEYHRDRLTHLNAEPQNTSLTSNDDTLFLAMQEVLEGAPPLSDQWQLYAENGDLLSRAQQASAATVIFSLHRNDEITALAAAIHSLRRARGARLKIVVREMQTSLRASDERLLMLCGVNAIVPFGAPLSRFLTLLEGVQGQIHSRHVPAELETLLKGSQPLQEKGYQPLDRFCNYVGLLINNALMPENSKGLLVALRPVPELKPQQVLTLCKPRRFGDLVTVLDDRLYLFLSACRYNDLDTALKFIFSLPHDEIFSNRLVWYEDQQILSEVRHMKTRLPSAWRDVAAMTLPETPAPAAPAHVAQVPQAINLADTPAKGSSR